MERKLTAILAADVVGYSRLMEIDEVGTLAALKSHRADLIDPEIAEWRGRIVKLMGDGTLVEFASVVNAVSCALAIQEGMAGRNDSLPEDRRIAFRIGVHLGDVMIEGDDIYGDGVNVAARLEGLAEPGGICISQQAFDQVETKLDLAYEDLGEQRVKNLARPVRVYRLRPGGEASSEPVATKRRRLSVVQVIGSATVLLLVVAGLVLGWWQPWVSKEEPASMERMALPLPDRPSIAVLPFNNFSNEPSEEYFADGMTEDLITDLSKVSGLFVIARNSVFTYKGRAVKVRQVAEELGVRYVLEGSVRRAGSQVRINVQLIDATTGGHLWAERYDGTLDDVFALQDEVSRKIVSALAVTLTLDEQQRSNRAQASPEAYDLLLRGLERFRRFTREANVEAREYFERAVAVDPDFARAHADIALTHAEDIFHGWSESPDRSSQLALDKAQYALTLDDNSRVAHFALAFTYLNVMRYDEALAANRRVLELNPNHAEGHAQRGLILSRVGRPAEALEAIRIAMRLDPRHPFFFVWILGQAQFLLKQTDEAITQFEKSIESNPDFAIGHLMLASAYAHAGRIEDAQWEAEEILVLLPDFTLTAEREKAAYKDPAHLEYYLEGLRKAGLPE
jgi:TolB-like protein/class 3 adenylate cyclase/cytochrome c-type biogenesis protein CcmH/NrfG